MMIALRIVIGIVGLMIAGHAFMSILRFGFDLIFFMMQSIQFTIAFIALWFAYLGQVREERARIGFTLFVGLIVCFTALVAGFVLPIIFNPDSNQGWLLGIFFLAPAGLVLGCIGGFIWARLYR